MSTSNEAAQRGERHEAGAMEQAGSNRHIRGTPRRRPPAGGCRLPEGNRWCGRAGQHDHGRHAGDAMGTRPRASEGEHEAANALSAAGRGTLANTSAFSFSKTTRHVITHDDDII